MGGRLEVGGEQIVNWLKRNGYSALFSLLEVLQSKPNRIHLGSCRLASGGRRIDTPDRCVRPEYLPPPDDTSYRRDAEGAGSLPGPRPWLLLIALCPPTALTTGSGTGPRSLATAWFYSRGRRRHGWSQRHWHATAPLSRATFADRQAPDFFVFVVWFHFVVFFSPSTKCLEMCESPVSFSADLVSVEKQGSKHRFCVKCDNLAGRGT